MRLVVLGRQTSAGIIVGLSSIIYSISYGALLFAGPFEDYVGFGITLALITAIVGALFSWASEEKTLVIGPDSNTTSVMANILAVVGTTGVSGAAGLSLTMAMTLVTTVVAAAAFYGIARANLSILVRYIPFSVMAGFLASTGWLMTSGAMNIISGTPLTMAGFEKLVLDPVRPELAVGFAVAAVLFALASRVSSAVLIPGVIVVASVAVNVFLTSHVCTAPQCAPDIWLFPAQGATQWLPPWKLSLTADDLNHLIQNLPGMLVVSFVGVLTILLTLASLELTYQKEFDLNRVLKVHASAALVSACFGGFTGILSMGRTNLNRQAGGGAISSTIAAGLCLATLAGAASLLAYIPRAALGGLILFLGLGMMKTWLWDQRRTTTFIDFGQIALILALVANYGFLVGFSAGLLISCVSFVVTYSRIPLADLATNLALFGSAVVRPEHEAETLRDHGTRTLVYRLSGYVFFGSASRIEHVFREMDPSIEAVIIDFTRVSGIDSSAIAVFQRILRRYRETATLFHLIHAPKNENSLRAIARDTSSAHQIRYHASLDHAIETAEEHILSRWGKASHEAAAFAFLDNPDDHLAFLTYCEHRRIRNGETLCAEHEISEEIFFIVSGSLEVIKDAGQGQQVRLAKLRAGAVVGELAFYTHEPRTASIVAVTDSEIYVLHRSALEMLRADAPELAVRFDHMVIRKVSHALSRTNKLVALYR